MRIYGWGTPLAGIIASICGQTQAALALTGSWILVNLASLCAPDALRRSAASAMSDAKIGRLYFTSLMMLALLLPVGFFWLHLEEFAASMLLSGVVLTAVRCGQEVMEARNDFLSSTLIDILTAIGLSAALLMAGARPEPANGCLIVSLLLEVLSLIFTLPTLFKGFRPSWTYFKELPLAFLRNLIWPICAGAIGYCIANGTYAELPRGLTLGFVAGCLTMELTRTTFRRTPSEDSSFKIGVSLTVFAISIANFALNAPKFENIALMMLAALGCGLYAYGSLHWTSLLPGLLLIALPNLWIMRERIGYELPEKFFLDGALALSIAILILTGNEFGLLWRKNRAKRLRRRAQKRS